MYWINPSSILQLSVDLTNGQHSSELLRCRNSEHSLNEIKQYEILKIAKFAKLKDDVAKISCKLNKIPSCERVHQRHEIWNVPAGDDQSCWTAKPFDCCDMCSQKNLGSMTMFFPHGAVWKTTMICEERWELLPKQQSQNISTKAKPCLSLSLHKVNRNLLLSSAYVAVMTFSVVDHDSILIHHVAKQKSLASD